VPGIAAAVETLVVQGRERGKLGGKPRRFLQDRDRLLDMGMAKPPFFLAQWILLLQQPGR